MAGTRDIEAYGRPFLRAMVRWSAVVAGATFAVGAFVARDVRFVATFALAAAIDIGSMAYLAARRPEAGEGLRTAAALGARLALKGVLLGVAAAAPAVFDFAGMALGVLVVDTTVLVAGSVRAVARMMRPPADDGMPEAGRKGGSSPCEGGV